MFEEEEKEVNEILEEIKWVGKTKTDEYGEECEACVQQDNLMKEIQKENPNVKVEHFDPDTTPYGKETMDRLKKKIIPHTEICKVDKKTNKKDCEVIVGYDEAKFRKRYLNKKQETQ